MKKLREEKADAKEAEGEEDKEGLGWGTWAKALSGTWTGSRDVDAMIKGDEGVTTKA